MSRNFPDLPWAVHLSEQLKTLSELMETLTFKLLELEERCAAQEGQLASLHHDAEHQNIEMAQAMDDRMRETEERLGRIETLLRQEQQLPAPTQQLRALARPTPIGKKGPGTTTTLEEQMDQPDPPHDETCFDDQFLEASAPYDQPLAS